MCWLHNTPICTTRSTCVSITVDSRVCCHLTPATPYPPRFHVLPVPWFGSILRIPLDSSQQIHNVRSCTWCTFPSNNCIYKVLIMEIAHFEHVVESTAGHPPSLALLALQAFGSAWLWRRQHTSVLNNWCCSLRGIVLTFLGRLE